MILCLYNSYDKLRLHDVHIRSVARAAPVCFALRFHLILLDFPVPMYNEVVETTTIGESGKYLEYLKTASHYSEFKNKLPLATLVVTTSRPDPQKTVDCRYLVNMYTRGESIALVVGLGRRGLPTSLRKKAPYHWDATGKGISLETCTAIGYIAAKIATMIELERTSP